jgi:hypothetical protein
VKWYKFVSNLEEGYFSLDIRLPDCSPILDDYHVNMITWIKQDYLLYDSAGIQQSGALLHSWIMRQHADPSQQAAARDQGPQKRKEMVWLQRGKQAVLAAVLKCCTSCVLQ